MKNEYFELVQLSSISEELWEGLPVFHPHAQYGKNGEIVCEWTEIFSDLDSDGYPSEWVRNSFDVGVVVSWKPDRDFPDLKSVRFIGSDGGALYYSPENLWVPKQIAEKLIK